MHNSDDEDVNCESLDDSMERDHDELAGDNNDNDDDLKDFIVSEDDDNDDNDDDDDTGKTTKDPDTTIPKIQGTEYISNLADIADLEDDDDDDDDDDEDVDVVIGDIKEDEGGERENEDDNEENGEPGVTRKRKRDDSDRDPALSSSSSDSRAAVVVASAKKQIKIDNLVQEIAQLTKQGANANPDSIQNLVLRLHAKWTKPATMTAIEFAHQTFEIDPNTVNENCDISAALETRIKAFRWEAMALTSLVHMRDMITDATASSAINKRFQSVCETIHNLYHMLYFEISAARRWRKNMTDSRLAFNVNAFKAVGERDHSKYQRLLIYMLGLFQQNNLRKRGDGVYEEITNAAGYKTRAWRRRCSISEYIYEVTPFSGDQAHWNDATTGQNVENAAKYFEKASDAQFQQLNRQRRVFSLRNGVLVISESNTNAKYVDRFFRYEDGVPSDLVAASYIDQDFNATMSVGYDYVHDATTDRYHLENGEIVDVKNGDARPPPSWYDAIKTPVMDKLWSTQKVSKDVQKVFWYMWGRMMWELGFDNWEKCMFFEGLAGTGKSTLIRHMISIYEPEDLGALSNRTEEKFGIYPLYGKFIWYCLEVKKDFGLGQAEFQSMLSAENMSMAIKFKTAETIIWNVPGVLAGNEVPAWSDNSGSIGRRILLMSFEEVVEDGDTCLAQKLKAEIGQHIRKAGVAYLLTRTLLGTRKLDAILPPYFKKTSEELQAKTHDLVAFLINSGVVKVGNADTTYMPKKLFINKLKQFYIDTSSKPHKWDKDFYGSVFSRYRIKSVVVTKTYNNEIKTDTYFLGVDLFNRAGKSAFLDDVCGEPQTHADAPGFAALDDTDAAPSFIQDNLIRNALSELPFA